MAQREKEINADLEREAAIDRREGETFTTNVFK